ncbi:DUF1080 domain-containing protein [Muricauda sp. CAU 1633]|nr:family 16 glycoside hydrolase [Muricauda sp. CAU 1633]MBO0322407.1 DUF1080 domain-containing protein [Muricauda sp. CAU 1633]
MAQTTETIPMQPDYWNIAEGAIVSFEAFDGRETMILNGNAVVKDMEFSYGVLEMDVYANTMRSFAGFAFRKQGGTMEETYMRMHKSRQPDAVQYTPTYNSESNWQLYREHQANVTFKSEGWNSLRVEVMDHTATIYVNGENVLQVNPLKSGNLIGEIGIFALFGNRFSNFRVTKMGKAELQESQPSTEIETEPGVITEWDITTAMPYAEGHVHFNDFTKAKTTKATTEKSGLLPISKYLVKPTSGNFENNKEAYTVASHTITVDDEQTKLFSFDYSDKIMVFLNGEFLFYGNNAFRFKGNQFQGHLGLGGNKLPIHLKKGENTLHCVVIDKANGWGLIGKVE